MTVAEKIAQVHRLHKFKFVVAFVHTFILSNQHLFRLNTETRPSLSSLSAQSLSISLYFSFSLPFLSGISVSPVNLYQHLLPVSLSSISLPLQSLSLRSPPPQTWQNVPDSTAWAQTQTRPEFSGIGLEIRIQVKFGLTWISMRFGFVFNKPGSG